MGFQIVHQLFHLTFCDRITVRQTVDPYVDDIQYIGLREVPLEPNGSLSMNKIGLGMPGDNFVVRHKFNVGYIVFLANHAHRSYRVKSIRAIHGQWFPYLNRNPTFFVQMVTSNTCLLGVRPYEKHGPLERCEYSRQPLIRTIDRVYFILLDVWYPRQGRCLYLWRGGPLAYSRSCL